MLGLHRPQEVLGHLQRLACLRPNQVLGKAQDGVEQGDEAASGSLNRAVAMCRALQIPHTLCLEGSAGQTTYVLAEQATIILAVPNDSGDGPFAFHEFDKSLFQERLAPPLLRESAAGVCAVSNAHDQFGEQRGLAIIIALALVPLQEPGRLPFICRCVRRHNAHGVAKSNRRLPQKDICGRAWTPAMRRPPAFRPEAVNRPDCCPPESFRATAPVRRKVQQASD